MHKSQARFLFKKTYEQLLTGDFFCDRMYVTKDLSDHIYNIIDIML